MHSARPNRLAHMYSARPRMLLSRSQIPALKALKTSHMSTNNFSQEDPHIHKTLSFRHHSYNLHTSNLDLSINVRTSSEIPNDLSDNRSRTNRSALAPLQEHRHTHCHSNNYKHTGTLYHSNVTEWFTKGTFCEYNLNVLALHQHSLSRTHLKTYVCAPRCLGAICWKQ